MPNNVKGTPIFRYLIADYLDIGTSATPDIRLMNVFENVDESPNAQTTDKHYVSDKSSTTITTGYQTQFPITGDRYKDNAVTDFIADIAEKQLLGVQAAYYRVNVFKPIEGKENTFYARKFTVEFAIDTLGGAGGEIATIEGNMNAQGDVIIGEFNTTTKTFTPADEAAPGDIGVLAVASAAGATTGTTHIVVAPALAVGNSYKYQTASTVTLPTLNAVLTTGWMTWNGTADITATDGQQIVIAEVDADNKAKKAGIATVEAAA